MATISLGSAADVDKAVAGAKKAFESYSQTAVEERVALLQRVIEVYKAKSEEMAQTISLEMGCPLSLSRAAQVAAGLGHLLEIVRVLEHFKFEDLKGSTLMRKEPIGVCGLITPWNWPMNQIAAKVAPALAAGCTVVLKPSEMAPLSAYLFAQILDQAGLPAGVFNLVNGDGPTVGAAIAAHRDVAMVSFTGSTRAGVAVALAAAPTVKRVTQELGGKSAHIILDDADLETAVKEGVQACFRNTGQSCNAPTRMLVPRFKMAQAMAAAKKTAEATQGWRSSCRRQSYWSAGQPGTIRQGATADSCGHSGGSTVDCRRSGPSRRYEQRLLREADHIRGGSKRHDDRARRDLRAGSVHDPLRG